MSLTAWIFQVRWDRRAPTEWKILHTGNVIAQAKYTAKSPQKRQADQAMQVATLERHLTERYKSKPGEPLSAQMKRVNWLDQIEPVIEKKNLLWIEGRTLIARPKMKIWLSEVATMLLSAPRKNSKRADRKRDVFETVMRRQTQRPANHASKNAALLLLLSGIFLTALPHISELISMGNDLGSTLSSIAGIITSLTSLPAVFMLTARIFGWSHWQ